MDKFQEILPGTWKNKHWREDTGESQGVNLIFSPPGTNSMRNFRGATRGVFSISTQNSRISTQQAHISTQNSRISTHRSIFLCRTAVLLRSRRILYAEQPYLYAAGACFHAEQSYFYGTCASFLGKRHISTQKLDFYAEHAISTQNIGHRINLIWFQHCCVLQG